MKKIYNLLFIFVLIFTTVDFVKANTLDDLISSSKLNKTSVIAVSVKDTETGKNIYKYNEKKLLHPASTLKVFSTFPAIDALGNNYNFETNFYTCNGNLYIKLGADPLLTSKDLQNAINAIKSKGFASFKNIYIDNTIADNVEWGVGWMWDDGTNPLMQKISAYNLDNNIVNVTVAKNENGIPIINTPSAFPITIMNNVKAGTSNNLYAIRHDWLSPDIVCIKGTIAANATVSIPINNMKRYFEKRLSYYFNRHNIKIENKIILCKNVPENAVLIESVKHPLSEIIPSILKNSDNKNAETVAKIAGGVKYKSQANLENQLDVFYEYWKNNNINTSEIVVADASGISRNNLVNVDFMTNALNKLYSNNGAETMKSYLAQPGEGTLSNRMLDKRGSLFLKTGTLSNISGITGYVIADNGKIYSVAILIQNFTYPSKEVKLFENQLIDKIQKL